MAKTKVYKWYKIRKKIMDWSKIYKVILEIGSFSGLLSILFTLREKSRKKPKFKYTFRGSSRENFTKDGHTYCRLTFMGDIKNQSSDPNSITNIYYAIWDGKNRTRTLAFGGEPEIETLPINQKQHLPMSFNSKETKRLSIQYEQIISGNQLEKILTEVTRVSAESHVYLPKYEPRLVFQDTNENIFEENGELLSRKLIDLWWTLPNSFESLKKGNPFPWLKHMWKILLNSTVHSITKIIYSIGV